MDTSIEMVEAPKLAVAASKALDEISKRLGNPPDCSTKSGWAVVDEVVRLWHNLYPYEVESWRHDRNIDLTFERTVQAHVKGGGYNPITYPPTLYALLKVMLPGQKLNDKKFMRDLAARHPLFKSTNLSI